MVYGLAGVRLLAPARWLPYSLPVGRAQPAASVAVRGAASRASRPHNDYLRVTGKSTISCYSINLIFLTVASNSCQFRRTTSPWRGEF